MQPSTEEFLNFLLWSVDKFAQPTFRNLTDSYESWAYRGGELRRQLRLLERQRFIQRDLSSPDERLYRLTRQGRLHALGDRDPESRWSRDWDGRWRMVLFDVPRARNSQRTRLRRLLRDHGFGRLQDSVWVTPDLMEDERRILGGSTVNVASLILLEARPCAGESDSEIVASAWDFADINRRYAQCLRILAARPVGALRDEQIARALSRWAAIERETWLAAVTRDPLLPERLLPPGYLGQETWHLRNKVLRRAGRQVRTFRA